MISRKLPRKQDCNVSKEDYISTLPDDIMCRIISCLNTTDAVRTSVLSKKWENKWTSIDTINITDEKRIRTLSRRKEREVAFINFMRRITTQAENVREFHMRLHMNYKVSETRLWISQLLTNQIEILDVETPTYSSTQLILRARLLKTNSLKEMVLKGPDFRVPTNICFTNLRSLLLEYVRLSNENSRSDTLILNFPLLETLEVSQCRWHVVKLVKIYAPALIKFSLFSQRYFGELPIPTINIHGDRLGEFTSIGGEPEDIFVVGSKVVSAKFGHVFSEDAEQTRGGLRIRRLLQEFACTLDQLTLSFNAAQAISISNKGISFTSFAKLRRLALDGECYDGPPARTMYGSTQVLLDLLHAMPCLKILNLQMSRWGDFDYEALESVPSCITSSLENIEFAGINDLVFMLRLAKFFLKTALSLKEFHVYNYNKLLQDILVEKMSAYPTGSGHVKIVGSPSRHGL